MPLSISKTIEADVVCGRKRCKMDQKSGDMTISLLNGSDSAMHRDKLLSTGAADISRMSWSKLEIACKITGTRINGCSYKM